MKITLLYLGKLGGGCVYSYEILRHLLEAGCNIQAVLSSYIENKGDFLKLTETYDTIKLLFVNTYYNKWNFIIRSLNIFRYRQIAQSINNYQPDCLYIPMISTWARFIMPFLNKDIKIITTVHDVSMHKGEENKILDKVNNQIIRKSDGIVVLTKSFVENISIKYNIPKEQIVWIRHANYCYYRPCSYIMSHKIQKKILFFGRIHEYKGISILLNAMDIIVKEIPDLILRIAGKGNLNMADQEKLLRLGGSVELHNKWICNSEIYKYFSDVDLLVAPYIEASQSGVVMLSYAFGKPVIVTDIGGLSEQIINGSGIIVPPNDTKALAQAVISIYRDKNRLIHMRDVANSLNETVFSWSHSAEILMSFIVKLDKRKN